MYCNKCGNKLNDSDKFCNKCGAKISIEKKNPNLPEDIIIMQKPGTYLKLSVLSFISMIVILFVFFILRDSFSDSIALFILEVFLLAIIVLLGLCTFYFFKSISEETTKPAIIINKEGITDNSTLSSLGLINWEDIENISIKNFLTEITRYVEIKVKDEQKYLSRKNSAARFFIKLNKSLRT